MGSKEDHRYPDLHPMVEVYEWYIGNGGVQLVDDGTRAGQSMLTVIVPDLDKRKGVQPSARSLLGGSAPTGAPKIDDDDAAL